MGKILFQLTPEIIDMIIFGMEYQSDKYCVDIKTGDVLPETEIFGTSGTEDVDSSVISVPDWLPADGFQVMESFVAIIHNPSYKETLRKVLSAGKGAFRNFKNIVNEHKTLTQQWHLHKDKVMRAKVIEWYNLNTEILKYNDIEENTDETENLILSDFIFSVDCSKWNNLIDDKSEQSIRESLGDQEKILADYLIVKNKSWLNIPGNTHVFVCAETIDGEFAGSISGGIIEIGDTHGFIAVANAIWVEKKFRGMGIARQLIDDFSKNAVLLKVERIIFELPGRGSLLISALEARGLSVFFTTMAVNSENL
jgi:GNAT superfamily N-acetyltransferase